MAKDFRGQDLRGQSFKNQDLTGADFSDCDLRGVDFSFANLTDAKFCNAKMGRTTRNICNVFVVTGVLGLVGFLIVFASNLLLVKVFTNILNSLEIYSEESLFIAIIFYTYVFIKTVLLAVNENRYIYIHLLVFSIILLLTLIDVFISNKIYTSYLFFALIISTILNAVSSIITSVVFINLNVKEEGSNIAVFLYLLYTMPLLIFVTLNLLPFVFHEDALNINALIPAFMLLIFQSYLSKRAIEKEEYQLIYLRNLILKYHCISGTKFDSAYLKENDFSNADLKFTSFINANIINCCFKTTKNHQVTLTIGTPLEPRKVRDLVIDGIITDKNFSTLDLRGLDFSGDESKKRDLQGFDFSHANLSGANLSHTQMTGAILEGWAIDTETRLDDIECNYYYYLENGEKKRMPPEGEEYKAGEFTRIFQKIANTIDIIAVNEIELAAIKLAVKKVKIDSGNDDIRVQAIEEKDGFIVVKVNVPKTEDIGQLYYKLKQEFTTIQTLLLSGESHQMKKIEEKIDDLKNDMNQEREKLEKDAATTINIIGSTINSDGIMIIGSDTKGDITQHKS